MKRFFKRVRRDESGFTFTEVMITLLILGIVMALAFDFLNRASFLTIRTQANAQSEQDAQLALRIVTEHLRGASPIGAPCVPGMEVPATLTPPLPAGYANCIRFEVKRTTTGLDTCARSEFVYALVGSGNTQKLIENRREYTGTGTTAPSCNAGSWRNRRVLLQKVANTASEPLFSYFSATGSPIAVTDTAAVKKAGSVRLTLAVRFKTVAKRAVFTSSAALRNNVAR
jgi:prepilin-type N-terminal cleavage/methylation domain-containing protein